MLPLAWLTEEELALQQRLDVAVLLLISLMLQVYRTLVCPEKRLLAFCYRDGNRLLTGCPVTQQLMYLANPFDLLQLCSVQSHLAGRQEGKGILDYLVHTITVSVLLQVPLPLVMLKTGRQDYADRQKLLRIVR